ncbi:MAG: sulfatase-like hydrolase/transferase [Verrucomicrobia bacterium]|nr:sulfatase-like hydrolase/transferase [Verrucomicrobiota bacterium]
MAILDPSSLSRKTIHHAVLLLRFLLAGTATLIHMKAEAAESQPPNFLIIFTDDQGINDVGCYGSEIPTPHIDSIAKEGLKFDSWYVASSICTPSRFGLLTGRNPSRSQDSLLGALMFLDPSDAVRGLQPGETTIASSLSRNGYYTGLIGKWHLGHGEKSLFPNQHGFDFSYGHTAGCIDFYTMSYGNTPDWYRNGKLIEQSGYATELITDEAIAFLKQTSKDHPFFLYLAYNAPHFGKGWDDGNNQTVNLLQPHPKDLARFQHIKDPTRRKFAAKVAALDDGIGRVLEALKEQNLDESTLVIFMTDHGGDPNFGGSNIPFRAGKATLFEGGIRVPCLMRWPGKIPAGSKTSSITSALDLYPTLAALAKVPISTENLDRIDITDVLLNAAKSPKRELFWELGSHEELKRGRWQALREGHYKYVQTPTDGEWLFNIEKDPFEASNLKESHPGEFSRLRERAREVSSLYRARD